ncbi:MAG: DUF3084 domain-containing protein [Armatimonadetes bacterium]|nr:DUF3084 domain-containing protein [Armatimonadota bacterium]
MTYTILFAIILVLVSGLIAYLGDLIGRKMGKRRLTLFGLRPRHTAIIVTTITGMLIAILTLGTMLTASSRLRQVLVRGERLAKENALFQTRNKKLHEKNLQLTTASRRLSQDVERKAAQVRTARKAEKAAVAARDRVELLARRLERQIQAEKSQLTALRRTGKLTEQQLQQTSLALDGRMKELGAVKSDLDKRNRELKERQRELSSMTAELASRVTELEEADRRIRDAERVIQADNEIMLRQGEKLMNETSIKDMLLTGDVVLQAGQEIGRRVIDSTRPASQIRSDLVALLESASDLAKSVEAGSDSGARATELVFRDAERRTMISPDDENVLINEAVNSIIRQGRAGSVDSILARAVVVSNTLKGERAKVVLNLYWNKLAFSRGDSISRRMIDGSASEGRILLAVMAFLRENVRSEAEKVGVIPVAGPDPDLVTEPISDIQLDELMELVEQIHSLKKQVELRAIAQKDIYCAGPLNLDNIGFAISTLTTAGR